MKEIPKPKKKSSAPTEKSSSPARRGLAEKSGLRRTKRKSNRRTAARSESIMVALDNPNGLRWVMEFAPIYQAILHGIELGLKSLGKQMQVCSIRSPEEFDSLIRGRPPDGLLFLASKNVIALKAAIGEIPCVSVLGNSCDGHFDRITYNPDATGQIPAELFLKNGITTAAILGPTEPGRRTTFGRRLASFCETMEDAGGRIVSLLSPDFYEPGNPSNQPRPEEIARLVAVLKATHPLPQGLFVMADNFVPSVYRHLTAAGLSPGTDLHLVSCNSETPYFAGLSPEPARVDIPSEEIGRRSVELLEWRARNPGQITSTTILQPSLYLPQGSPLVA